MNLGNTTGRPGRRPKEPKPAPGCFNVKQFANWITGFTTDELAHSSPQRVDIQRIRPNTARRYF